MKQNLLALALTLAIGCGLGLYIWHDYENTRAELAGQQPATLQGQASAGAPEAPIGTPKPYPQPPRHHANGLYRCDGQGAVTYQDEPCPRDAKQAEVENGSLNVITRTAPVQPTRAASTGGEKVGLIARADEAWFGERNSAECASLRLRIARIDDNARRYSTEPLKEERRKAVRRKYDLGCSEFD